MKKTYIEPKNTVVKIEVEQFIAESLAQHAGARGDDAEAREIQIVSEEFEIIARSAWQNW